MTMLEYTPKTGKSSLFVRISLYRNRSGLVGLVVRKLLMFTRVENGVTNVEKKKNAKMLGIPGPAGGWDSFQSL